MTNKLKDNQVRAFNRLIRASSQKLNLVAESIRGLPVNKAVDALTFSKKRSANDAKKTLLSAIANAENNKGMKADSLIVKESFVGKSITMKRMNPRSKGRAGPILKPFSSLTIILESVVPTAKAEKPAKSAAKKETVEKKAVAKPAAKKANKGDK